MTRRDVDAEALRLVDQQRLDGAVQALDQRVGDPLVHERARRGRALLAGEAERGVGERGDDVVEVGVGVDDHAVLAAHLGHDALEVPLAGRELGGGLEDLEPDRAGAGERDRVHAGVRDERRADVALAGQEASAPAGTPAAWSASTIASAQAGDCSAGLSTTPLPVARPAATMPAGIASGKFHGPMTATTPRAA